MADDYTPRYTGDTANPLQVTFQDHLGVAYSLAGLEPTSFTLSLTNVSNGIEIVGTGVWSVVIAGLGQAQYVWSPADVALPGLFMLQVQILFPTGTLTFDSVPLEILVP